jgi:beta-fructofuranosidase
LRPVEAIMKTNVRGLFSASQVVVTALAAALVWAPALGAVQPKALRGDESPAEILAKAAGAMKQAVRRIDPDDPTRPAYHYLPPANWMNDICGTIYHDGWYHLFHLQNPFGDGFSRFVVWGHARSRDLIHWQRLGMTLPPSPDKGELACYTGAAAVNKKGTPMIFYTVQPRHGGAGRTVGLALGSNDLLRWEKHSDNPLLVRGRQGDPTFAGGWDAPFLFQERGRTFMILGAILGDRSVVPIYEATDEALLDWTYRGILFGISRREVGDLECANFLKLGDRWMLVFSPDGRQMRYFVGP